MEEQLDLPLITILDPDIVDPNRKTYLKELIKNTYLSSNSTWKIFRIWSRDKTDNLWLGIRTHFYETDYDYIEKVSREEAEWLIKNTPASEFMDCLKQ